MIYLYDQAIVQDLNKSFNPRNVPDPVVKVIDTEAVFGLAAQIQNDDISFPIVAVSRDPNTSIDNSRTNFTRIHKGVPTVIDPSTNELYYERSIPISLKYAITVITTNVVDMDEIVKELLFKYSNMYFLDIKLPYESKRKISFGVVINQSEIERKSTTSNYISEGKLHETIIPVNCEGCVLISYTPVKLKAFQLDPEISLE